MHKVTFKFENSEDVTVFAAFGESLLEVARKTNVAIDAPCGGNGACGKCKVKLVGGTLDSKKTSHISDEEYAAGWRLACISKIIDDVEVLVPDIASAYKSRMKMADLSSAEEVKIFEELKEQIAEVGIELKNNLEVIDVTMSAPTLDDTMPDNERFTWAVEEVTGMDKIRVPYSVIKKMAHVFRASDFHVKAVIRKTDKDVFVYDVLPASEEPVVAGIAIDIGTTSVSAIIIDMLNGAVLQKVVPKRPDPLWCGCDQPYYRVRKTWWKREASGCDHQRNFKSADSEYVCQREDQTGSGLPSRHRRQHHDEPSSDGSGCRSGSYGALYSHIFQNEFAVCL